MRTSNFKVSFKLSDNNPKSVTRDYNLNLIDKEDFEDEIHFTSVLDLKAYIDFFDTSTPMDFNDMRFYIEKIVCDKTDGKINYTMFLLEEKVYFHKIHREEGIMAGEHWL